MSLNRYLTNNYTNSNCLYSNEYIIFSADCLILHSFIRLFCQMHVRKPDPEGRYGYCKASARWNVSHLKGKKKLLLLYMVSPREAAMFLMNKNRYSLCTVQFLKDVYIVSTIRTSS